MPLLADWHMDVVGFGQSLDDQDAYYLIRGFDDHAHLQASQDAFYASPGWRQGPRDAVLSMIQAYTNTVLSLTSDAIEAMRETRVDRADPGVQNQTTKVRRVTTGHDEHGKSVVVSDTTVEGITAALLPGDEFHRLWGAEQAPVFPDDGAQQEYQTYFPPPGGFRFMIFTVGPQGKTREPSPDRKAQWLELNARLPGLAPHMERGNPGMHTTDTIDFEYILSGEVWLELDDGATVHLRAGDTVVQNGTRHAWRNPGAEPCRIVVFMAGVARHPSGLDVARSAA